MAEIAVDEEAAAPEAAAPARATRKPARVANGVSSSGTRAAPTAKAVSRVASVGPREACGSRTQFSLYRCMQTQCAQARYYSHPSCKRLRLRDEVD